VLACRGCKYNEIALQERIYMLTTAAITFVGRTTARSPKFDRAENGLLGFQVLNEILGC
jgi:hypothetical protein